MNKACTDLLDYFERHEFKVRMDEDRPVFRAGFTGETGRWQCLASLEREDSMLMFFSILPALATEERRIDCSELITRINCRLWTGHFVMDWSDGEILFKTSTFIPESGLSDDLLDPMIGLNLQTMDQFFPVFMKVLYTAISPEQALKELDQENEPRPRFELN